MKHTQPFFEMENCTVFRDGWKVFDNFSITVSQGTHTAILGPNGCGKSTLLKLIDRELYPAFYPESRMRTFGKEQLDVWELRKRVGVVSAELQHLYMESVIGRDVVLSGFYSSIAVGGTQEYTHRHYRQAEELLARLGAAHLSDRRFGTLSTGEQRRLLLARALVHHPDILLLDEPTAGLDLNARFLFFETLNGLLGSEKTILLVSHHLEEIPPGIEHIILLKEGRLFLEGPPERILTGKNMSALFDRPLEVHLRDGFRYALPT
jgi:iron complex transport system ATP-binding protein